MEQQKKNWFKRHPIWSTVGGIFILFIIIGSSGGDSQTSGVVENAEQPVQAETTELQKYVASIQTNVFPLLQLSNERVTTAGELGSQLQIEAAQVQISSAKRFNIQALEELNRLTPPEEGIKLHGILKQALDKYSEAINVYESGIANLDAETINRGTALYQEGTDLISQATVELNKLLQD